MYRTPGRCGANPHRCGGSRVVADVDIFVPSYNESLEVVKPTVFAALNLDWPADKLKVYILDDGRRPQFREFAASCGANT